MLLFCITWSVSWLAAACLPSTELMLILLPIMLIALMGLLIIIWIRSVLSNSSVRSIGLVAALV
jgi:hypothetical protein